MAELLPIPFSTLLRRIYHEYTRTEAIFDLPKRKFYVPDASVDLSVVSCGNPAANPLGPAAGPQTQLAQNIVLSWLAGARIIELKTVQVNDRLELARPCIDIATIGYNTEWSQELRLEDSAREYVKASMIIEILKRWLFTPGTNLDTIFDVSVGYDLSGITSPQLRQWLGAMQDASGLIGELRTEIPEEFAEYRSLPFSTKISDSITLSTFHGTPADEIERICEFLLVEMGYHVVVKMNPPMLGKEKLEQLLHGTLGYTAIEVNPKVYDVNIAFGDAAEMMTRLRVIAERHKKTVGVKFGNTLEVKNTGTFLKDPVQYLSGQPLHVLHLALVNEWRVVFGADYPISFSAGVDANNFPDCVSMGLVPTTTCTDLLRPGGYGRLRQYLVNLEQKMKSAGVRTIDEFILHTASRDGIPSAAPEKTNRDVPRTLSAAGRAMSQEYQSAVVKNAADVLNKSMDDPRYRFSHNNRPPRKIGSHLALWDCINCDKCIPVCPNDANFTFDAAPVTIDYQNLEIRDDGWSDSTGGTFTIAKQHQIGNYIDACNECGNCDVFCPEDGGPFIEKPRFFSSLASYRAQHGVSGFALTLDEAGTALYGRIGGKEYMLTAVNEKGMVVFTTDNARVTVDGKSGAVLDAVLHASSAAAHVDMGMYHAMTSLMKGVLNTNRVHYVNTELMPR